MLDKAKEQSVVTNVTNLYDRFFVPTCNITAARLPYFEGSFWSSSAELLMSQETESGVENVKSLSRRALKGNKIKDSNDAKNILLMRKVVIHMHLEFEYVYISGCLFVNYYVLCIAWNTDIKPKGGFHRGGLALYMHTMLGDHIVWIEMVLQEVQGSSIVSKVLYLYKSFSMIVSNPVFTINWI